MKKVDDFKLLRGFADRQMDGWTNKRTDICECRVAFATENKSIHCFYILFFRLKLGFVKEVANKQEVVINGQESLETIINN